MTFFTPNLYNSFLLNDHCSSQKCKQEVKPRLKLTEHSLATPVMDPLYH